MSDDDSRTILTLSGTIPGEPGVGGVILEDLYRGSPAGSLTFIPAVTSQVIELGWLERAPELAGHVERRYETAWRPLGGIAGEAIAWAARKGLFERHCRQLVDPICQNPAAQTADAIWAVLDCPTTIQIATSVASRLGKPLIVMIWDTPELLIDRLQMDRWSAANLMHRFGQTIQQAERVGVICEQMRDSYQQKYGAKPYVIMRHGTGQEIWHPANDPPPADRIVIGFAGSITAQQPFRLLIQTLDALGWRIHGKEVTLRMIGSRYTLDSRGPQHIEYFGWRSLEETVRLLSECSMLYLPQPFQSHLRPLAELSFPTKLTSYLAAGRRVLLHAPPYASITPFLRNYPIGLQCTSLESQSLGESLQRLDQMPPESLAMAIDSARADEFNSRVFLNRFRELVGPKKGDGGQKPVRPGCSAFLTPVPFFAF